MQDVGSAGKAARIAEWVRAEEAYLEARQEELRAIEEAGVRVSDAYARYRRAVEACRAMGVNA